MIRSLFASAVAFAALLAARPAAAQFDTGAHIILQGDEIRAAIYVPAGQDTCEYVEHWFLFEGYVYPSLRSGASFTAEPVSDAYGSLERFLAAQRADHPKGTYIEVFSVEHRAGCK